MTATELADATREFDSPSRQPTFAKAPAAEKARHDRIMRNVRRRRGRPPVGAGAQRIQLTMERGLLPKVDSSARAAGLTRSQFLARCVAQVVAGAA